MNLSDAYEALSIWSAGPGITEPKHSRSRACGDAKYWRELLSNFVAAQARTNVPAPILIGIASRESLCGAALTNGWGDHGHAFGIMQVDKRYHKYLGQDAGPASEAHIVVAARIFSGYYDDVTSKHPGWPADKRLEGACVAYNSGVRNVQTLNGMNIGTTGNNYGVDVMARSQQVWEVIRAIVRQHQAFALFV